MAYSVAHNYLVCSLSLVKHLVMYGLFSATVAVENSTHSCPHDSYRHTSKHRQKVRFPLCLWQNSHRVASRKPEKWNLRIFEFVNVCGGVQSSAEPQRGASRHVLWVSNSTRTLKCIRHNFFTQIRLANSRSVGFRRKSPSLDSVKRFG